MLLTAPEYTEGRLEWYHFEQLQASGTLGVTGQPTVHRAFRVPAPLDFAGMPNPRFWTFEDRSVQFDLIDVLSNPDVEPSPATMMVLDFALSYSDDWFLLPIALDAWSLFDATAVAVTDVFGDVTVAKPPGGRWNLFRLDSSGTRFTLSNLFVAAGPAEAIDGPPLEEVHFLADEVANVAWGVERLVPHATGHAVDASGPPRAAARRHADGAGLDVGAAVTAGQLVSVAAGHHRPSGAGRPVVGAHAAPGGTGARRAARLAPAAASVRGAARGRAGQPALAVGTRHRWNTPFLDGSQQDPAPDGHRASRALRRGRVPPGRRRSGYRLTGGVSSERTVLPARRAFPATVAPLWTVTVRPAIIALLPQVIRRLSPTGEDIGALFPPLYFPYGLAFRPAEIEVLVDVKPGSCRNPLNIRARGVTPRGNRRIGTNRRVPHRPLEPEARPSRRETSADRSSTAQSGA